MNRYWLKCYDKELGQIVLELESPQISWVNLSGEKVACPIFVPGRVTSTFLSKTQILLHDGENAFAILENTKEGVKGVTFVNEISVK